MAPFACVQNFLPNGFFPEIVWKNKKKHHWVDDKIIPANYHNND